MQLFHADHFYLEITLKLILDWLFWNHNLFRAYSRLCVQKLYNFSCGCSEFPSLFSSYGHIMYFILIFLWISFYEHEKIISCVAQNTIWGAGEPTRASLTQSKYPTFQFNLNKNYIYLPLLINTFKQPLLLLTIITSFNLNLFGDFCVQFNTDP